MIKTHTFYIAGVPYDQVAKAINQQEEEGFRVRQIVHLGYRKFFVVFEWGGYGN